MIYALEQCNRNENNGITLQDFTGGTMLFAFNLTPDLQRVEILAGVSKHIETEIYAWR